MFKLLLTVVFILHFCISCQRVPVSYTHIEGKAQGTTFSIRYHDEQQRDFSLSIDSIFRVIDHSMSLWDSTSIISRINRNETGIRPDEHFIRVFEKANQVSRNTSGAFDVTVGSLVQAWGFGATKSGHLPDSATVDSLKKLTGFEKVRMDNGYLVKATPGIQIDFNAIAQGYTVDVMSDFLLTRHISDFLVEIGGEVRAKGENERNTIWQVGIDKPTTSAGDERPLQTSLPLVNKSLATSGNYRKFISKGGKKLGHIIDPASGYPTQHNIVSVSVMADDCISADAYATAFSVLGIEKSMEIAGPLGLEIFFIYLDPAGELKTESTPGFPK